MSQAVLLGEEWWDIPLNSIVDRQPHQTEIILCRFSTSILRAGFQE
jgi:hypothetical protein